MFFKSITFTDPCKYKGSGVFSCFLADVLTGTWNHDEIYKNKCWREMMLKSECSTVPHTKTNSSSEML